MKIALLFHLPHHTPQKNHRNSTTTPSPIHTPRHPLNKHIHPYAHTELFARCTRENNPADPAVASVKRRDGSTRPNCGGAAPHPPPPPKSASSSAPRSNGLPQYVPRSVPRRKSRRHVDPENAQFPRRAPSTAPPFPRPPPPSPPTSEKKEPKKGKKTKKNVATRDRKWWGPIFRGALSNAFPRYGRLRGEGGSPVLQRHVHTWPPPEVPAERPEVTSGEKMRDEKYIFAFGGGGGGGGGGSLEAEEELFWRRGKRELGIRRRA